MTCCFSKFPLILFSSVIHPTKQQQYFTIRKDLTMLAKTNLMNLLLALFLIMKPMIVESFVPTSSWHSSSTALVRHSSLMKVNMIFGAPKDDGSPGDYVCKVSNPIPFCFSSRKTWTSVCVCVCVCVCIENVSI
jgi:hypothetical protein